MALLEMLAQQVGGAHVQQISNQLGTDAGTTQKAIAAALPMLLSGVASNATASPEGARSLASALEQDHDGSVLDNMSALLGMFGGNQTSSGGGLGALAGMLTQSLGSGQAPPTRAMNGDGILGHIFGQKRTAAEETVAQASGMDLGTVAKLLPLLAPIVMGQLGKVKRQQNLDADGLANVLGREQNHLQQEAPSLGGLAGMLDADGDGSVVDDLANLASKSGLLGGLFGGNR